MLTCAAIVVSVAAFWLVVPGLLSAFWFAVVAPSLSSNATAGEPVKCTPNELGRRYEKLPAPNAPTVISDIVHTRIGGRDFYVPHNFFRHPQIGCGAEESGMLLRVLLPDLKPYSEETKEIFAAQRGWDMQMNILLGRPKLRPFEELISDYLKEAAAQPPSAETHGLFHGRHEHGDDVFFHRDGLRVTQLIRCRPVQPDRSPDCGHYFKFAGYDIKITYGRKHLPNWRLIEDSTTGLLASFVAPRQN